MNLLRPAMLTPEQEDRVRPLLPAAEPELLLPEGRPRTLRVSEPSLDGNELTYVSECIRSGWISSAGAAVRRFESAFAEATGCRHGVACSSGTAALHLIFATLGLGPGDEVIVPSFTMIAVPNAVAYTGARPVPVDSEPYTWNLDPDAVAAALTPRTKAIAAVHTYGHPADMDPLRAIADRAGVALIEDAAEAHGARYKGRPAGSLARAAAFSFYGNKILTTGEGGMVTTNEEEFASLARELRDHAFSPNCHFWHRYRGFNYRMTSLQAALGFAQVERMETLVAARQRNADHYIKGLAGIPGLGMPPSAHWAQSVFWMFGVTVGETFGMSRDDLRIHLARAGVETRTFFLPVHLQPLYIANWGHLEMPVAERLCLEGLYLPSGGNLSPADIAYVCACIREAAA